MFANEKKKTTRPPEMIPYSFTSTVAVLAAEAAVKLKFPELKVYCNERILFVAKHPSMIMGFAIDDFVKSLGGRNTF